MYFGCISPLLSLISKDLSASDLRVPLLKENGIHGKKLALFFDAISNIASNKQFSIIAVN